MTDRPRGMRNRVVMMAAVAAFALAVGGLAVVAARSGGSGTGGDLPRLPFGAAGATGGPGGVARDAASTAMGRPSLYPMSAPVEYRLASGVSQPADHARAYRLPTVTADQVAALGRRLHVTAATASHGTDWALDDGSHMLFVDSAGQWAYGPSGSAGVAASSGIACAPCPPGRLCAQVCQPPARPDGTPTRDEAEQAARAFWAGAGVEPGAAKLAVDDEFSQWRVTFARLVGAALVSNDDTAVVVGAHGAVVSATGRIGTPRLVGDYPLVSLAEAVTRLNHQFGGGPGCWTSVPRCETPMMGGAAGGSVGGGSVGTGPADGSGVANPEPRRLGPPDSAPPASAPPTTGTTVPPDAETTVAGHQPGIHSPAGGPQPARVVTLTAVRLGLEVVDGYLVPVYVFGLADGTELAPISAVPDRLLATPQRPVITTTSITPKTLEPTTSP